VFLGLALRVRVRIYRALARNSALLAILIFTRLVSAILYSRYNSRRAAAIEDYVGRTFLYTLGALMALIILWSALISGLISGWPLIRVRRRAALKTGHNFFSEIRVRVLNFNIVLYKLSKIARKLNYLKAKTKRWSCFSFIIFPREIILKKFMAELCVFQNVVSRRFLVFLAQAQNWPDFNAARLRMSTAWRWWRYGFSRISFRWLAEHVTFSLTDDQPSFEYLTYQGHGRCGLLIKVSKFNRSFATKCRSLLQ
jgi:hypothetical protein